MLALALAAAVGLGLLASSARGPAARASGPAGVRGEGFVDVAGRDVFLLGVNYEGPADRAWRMWEEGAFDPRLISADLQRARSAGLGVVRVFIQAPLAEEIRAGRWAKLDGFLRLADLYGLKVILTFADYPDRNLSSLTAVDTVVAARYRGRSTILAYDLKNEPRFGDLALAEYPPGTYVALQDPALVPVVGESIRREELPEYRESEVGRARIPARLDDERAYTYANMLAAYLGFLEDSYAWNREHSSTSVAYLGSLDSAHWNPLKDALNDTLATWIKIRADAARAGDPEATVTIGHADPILASLPANNLLDYRTLHRYPQASEEGVRNAIVLFRDVRAAMPGKPLVLGEFGFANAEVPEERSAELEAQFVRGVRDAGAAGALKWMLNDFPLGHNERENTLGMFRGDGTPKPVVAAFRELARLPPPARAGLDRPLDYEFADGHFFTQTNGRPPGRDPSGFRVTNADGIPFWDVWQRLGGEHVGYPVSRRVLWQGAPTQVFRRAVFQWDPKAGVVLLDVLDELHARGADPVLEARERIPRRLDPALETGIPQEELAPRRLALLDASPAIQERYFQAPDPILLFGLPTSPVTDMGNVFAVRTQRGALFQWKVSTGDVGAGEVTTARGGELAVRFGLFPVSALVPEPPPSLP